MTTLYIFYLSQLGKYYVGTTTMSIDDRLSRHLHDHGGYTSQSKDWKCIYTKEFEDKTEALKQEKTIKKRGIRRYLDDIGYDYSI